MVLVINLRFTQGSADASLTVADETYQEVSKRITSHPFVCARCGAILSYVPVAVRPIFFVFLRHLCAL